MPLNTLHPLPIIQIYINFPLNPLTDFQCFSLWFLSKHYSPPPQNINAPQLTFLPICQVNPYFPSLYSDLLRAMNFHVLLTTSVVFLQPRSGVTKGRYVIRRYKTLYRTTHYSGSQFSVDVSWLLFFEVVACVCVLVTVCGGGCRFEASYQSCWAAEKSCAGPGHPSSRPRQGDPISPKS